MVNTTLITGILRDASGVILPNTLVQFTRPGPAAQDGAVIPSKTVSATSDASGVISINLYTGNYAAKIMLSPYPEQFQLPVPPPTGSPVDWSGLVNGAPTVVTPDAVLDAQAARDAAIVNAQATAADRIQTGQDVIAANAASASAQASATASANASVHTGSIKMNANAVVSDIIIPAGFNAASVGPLTIQPGITVTVSPDSVWAIL